MATKQFETSAHPPLTSRRRSEEKYRDLVERARDGIAIIHRGRLVYVNPHFARLTGYRTEELSGRSAETIISPALIRNLLGIYKRRLAGLDEPNICESRLRRKDGSEIDVEFSIGTIPYNHGTASLTIVRDISERKKAERERIETERRLRFLSSCLLKAQEAERNRLSKELHDELGHSLALLKHMLRSDGRGRRGEDALEMVDHIIENLRRISRDLSPSILADLGLTTAIEWIVKNFAAKHGIAAAAAIADVDALFSEDMKINLYRIVQESLANIGKHAGATRFKVVVRRSKNRVAFVIEDNGCGFSTESKPGAPPEECGMGLDIMTERARMLGAAFSIRSRPKRGTRITLVVPRPVARKRQPDECAAT
jgi:PAS domain S-box-containing protein